MALCRLQYPWVPDALGLEASFCFNPCHYLKTPSDLDTVDEDCLL